jgi:transaldolase
MNQLEQLKTYTTVVADTGNFKQLAQFAPRDATTNPSLILKAVLQPTYAPLLTSTVATYRSLRLDQIVDRVLVAFGREILKVVPGRVSTEIDARLSFDREASINRARHIIDLYQQAGIGRERVLIKIAATWEGIQAAKTLQREGIQCNLTLLFSFCQAVVCASADVRLISPFVGRVYDWHRKHAGADWDEAANAGVNDPGVRMVTQIWKHYKHSGIATEIMGASFRNLGQIAALAGCDLLTISPELLAELQAREGPLPRQLNVDHARKIPQQPTSCTEAQFRYALNADAMATEKLAEGIRSFAADSTRLDTLIAAEPR